MAIQNSFPKDEKQVVDSALSTTSTNPVRNAIITSNINSINTTLSSKANTSDVLTKTNTTAFTPTANYHPATKAYVDSKAGGSNGETLVTNKTDITLYEDESITLISGSTCLRGTYRIRIIMRAISGSSYDIFPDIRFNVYDAYSSKVTGAIYRYTFNEGTEGIAKSSNLLYGDSYGHYFYFDPISTNGSSSCYNVELYLTFEADPYQTPSYGYLEEKVHISGSVIEPNGLFHIIGGYADANVDSEGFASVELIGGGSDIMVKNVLVHKLG